MVKVEPLSPSDMVVVTLPLTAQTAGMTDSEENSLMRPGSALIVVCRGGIVEEGALAEVLQPGHLRGAEIDAPVEEPLPADNPLGGSPGAVVNPPNSTTTPGTAQRGRAIMLDHMSWSVRGGRLRSVGRRAGR